MKTAQLLARTQLAQIYPEEYREYYLKHKGDLKGHGINARSRSRALTQLISEHRREYQDTYQSYKRLGYPSNSKYKKKLEEKMERRRVVNDQ